MKLTLQVRRERSKKEEQRPISALQSVSSCRDYLHASPHKKSQLGFHHVLLHKGIQPCPLRSSLRKLRVLEATSAVAPDIHDKRPKTAIAIEKEKFQSIRAYVKAAKGRKEEETDVERVTRNSVTGEMGEGEFRKTMEKIEAMARVSLQLNNFKVMRPSTEQTSSMASLRPQIRPQLSSSPTNLNNPRHNSACTLTRYQQAQPSQPLSIKSKALELGLKPRKASLLQKRANNQPLLFFKKQRESLHLCPPKSNGPTFFQRLSQQGGLTLMKQRMITGQQPNKDQPQTSQNHYFNKKYSHNSKSNDKNSEVVANRSSNHLFRYSSTHQSTGVSLTDFAQRKSEQVLHSHLRVKEEEAGKVKEYLDDEVVQYCMDNDAASTRNISSRVSPKAKNDSKTIFKSGLSKFQSLENLMLKCERERRVLARSSQRLERRNRQLDKALSRMRDSVCKNIDKNKNDIYGGFIEIVPDEDSKPTRVLTGGSTSCHLQHPPMKAIIYTK